MEDSIRKLFGKQDLVNKKLTEAVTKSAESTSDLSKSVGSLSGFIKGLGDSFKSKISQVESKALSSPSTRVRVVRRPSVTTNLTNNTTTETIVQGGETKSQLSKSVDSFSKFIQGLGKPPKNKTSQEERKDKSDSSKIIESMQSGLQASVELVGTKISNGFQSLVDPLKKIAQGQGEIIKNQNADLDEQKKLRQQARREDRKENLFTVQKNRISDLIQKGGDFAGEIGQKAKNLKGIFEGGFLGLLGNIAKGAALFALLTNPKAIAEAIGSISSAFVSLGETLQSEDFQKMIGDITRITGEIIKFVIQLTNLGIKSLSGGFEEFRKSFDSFKDSIEDFQEGKYLESFQTALVGIGQALAGTGGVIAGVTALGLLLAPGATLSLGLRTLNAGLSNFRNNVNNFQYPKPPSQNPTTPKPTTTAPTPTTSASTPTTSASTPQSTVSPVRTPVSQTLQQPGVAPQTPTTGSVINPATGKPFQGGLTGTTPARAPGIPNPQGAANAATSAASGGQMFPQVKFNTLKDIFNPGNLRTIGGGIVVSAVLDWASREYIVNPYQRFLMGWKADRLVEMRQNNPERLDEFIKHVIETMKPGDNRKFQILSLLSAEQKDGNVLSDQQLLQLSSIQQFQNGSLVPGLGEGDKIPALLEPNEYVLNKRAVQQIGVDNLDRLNFDMFPRFQNGGIIEHIHGEPGRDGYRADHGTQAQAHDHFAFSSPELMEQVKRQLESGQTASGRAYTVGSTFRPGDPGYHGVGQAFDIPWSQFGSGPINAGDFTQSRQLYADVVAAVNGSQGQGSSNGTTITRPDGSTRVFDGQGWDLPENVPIDRRVIAPYDPELKYQRGASVRWSDGSIRVFDGQFGWDKPENMATSVHAPTRQPGMPDYHLNVQPPSSQNSFTDMFGFLAGFSSPFTQIFDVLKPVMKFVGTGAQNMFGLQGTGDSTTSSESVTTSSVTPSTTPANAKQVYDYMKSIGLSDVHSKGLLANAIRESSLRPGAVGDGGNSYGLFQWNIAGGRRDRFVQAVPDWRANWKGQIDYALREPGEPGPTWKAKSFSTAQE